MRLIPGELRDKPILANTVALSLVMLLVVALFAYLAFWDNLLAYKLVKSGIIRTYPGPIRAQSPTSLDVRVREAVSELPPGYLAFNPITEMRVGEADDFTARVSQSVYDKIAEKLHGGRSVSSSPIRIAPYMSAELMYDTTEFRVTDLDDRDQFSIAQDGRLSWVWRITPLTSGAHELHLIVHALFSPIEGGAHTSVEVASEFIEMSVNSDPAERAREFLMDNWKWIWTAILVPFLPWVWAKYQLFLNLDLQKAPSKTKESEEKSKAGEDSDGED